MNGNEWVCPINWNATRNVLDLEEERRRSLRPESAKIFHVTVRADLYFQRRQAHW